jgi:hypothetical protein
MVEAAAKIEEEVVMLCRGYGSAWYRKSLFE